jgi:hypothetical protein
MTPMSPAGDPLPSAIECRQIAELLAEYLDGSLPGQLVELIEWHIDDCAPCVAFLNTYRGTVKAAAALRDVSIPVELRRRLLAVLRQKQESLPPPLA